jgi:hypothetical protein
MLFGEWIFLSITTIFFCGNPASSLVQISCESGPMSPISGGTEIQAANDIDEKVRLSGNRIVLNIFYLLE